MTQLEGTNKVWQNALIVVYDIEYSGNIQYNFWYQLRYLGMGSSSIQ